MTQLRQKMLEELQRRDYSHRTAKTYIRIVRDFAAYFHRSPDKLGPEHIRRYQAYLFQSKKLSTASVKAERSRRRFCGGTPSPSGITVRLTRTLIHVFPFLQEPRLRRW